jgi:hypothetical protein
MDILIYGTINSIMLALMALGFALVYGTSRIPNFAHGAIYVLYADSSPGHLFGDSISIISWAFCWPWP